MTLFVVSQALSKFHILISSCFIYNVFNSFSLVREGVHNFLFLVREHRGGGAIQGGGDKMLILEVRLHPR